MHMRLRELDQQERVRGRVEENANRKAARTGGFIGIVVSVNGVHLKFCQ